MSPQEPEDFNRLFKMLLKKGKAYIGHLGCPYPNECAHDALTEYFFDRRFRGPERAHIIGELIELNFPGARDQIKVLTNLAMYEVKGKWSHCRDCQYRTQFCPIADDFNTSEDDGWPANEHVLIDPKTPADIFELKETLNSLYAASDQRQRDELACEAAGYSAKEIAKLSDDTPGNVRQRRSRRRKKFKDRFDTSIFRRWNR